MESALRTFLIEADCGTLTTSLAVFALISYCVIDTFLRNLGKCFDKIVKLIITKKQYDFTNQAAKAILPYLPEIIEFMKNRAWTFFSDFMECRKPTKFGKNNLNAQYFGRGKCFDKIFCEPDNNFEKSKLPTDPEDNLETMVKHMRTIANMFGNTGLSQSLKEESDNIDCHTPPNTEVDSSKEISDHYVKIDYSSLKTEEIIADDL